MPGASRNTPDDPTNPLDVDLQLTGSPAAMSARAAPRRPQETRKALGEQGRVLLRGPRR
jgi:hypothetical protein